MNAPSKNTDAKIKDAKTKAEPSEYVVLERMTVIVPDEKGAVTDAPSAEAWIEVGETDTGKAKSHIEGKIVSAVVGDREGTFKAVAKRAWKGGVKRAQTTIWKDEVLS